MENTVAHKAATTWVERSRDLAPKEDSRGLLGWVAGKYNRLHRSVLRKKPTPTSFAELRDVRELACVPSDIDEHLELMFTETLLLRPRLIVELGVRGGVSTFVFARAAKICGASIVSVDLDDCATMAAGEGWHFVQEDDISFALTFPHFCRARALPREPDLLFIDTSHYYEHTVNEIKAWFPLVSMHAKVIFHDTNLNKIGPRSDGCLQLSWDNDRGVIRAIEEYLGITINERRRFIGKVNGWLIRHWPNCNGLTILDRIDS